MRTFFSFLILNFAAWGASSVKNPFEEQLLQAVRRDWPSASRSEVKNLRTHKTAPKNAVLMNFQPRPLLGSVSFELVWDQDGVPQKTFGNAIVKVENPVAVAIKDIRKGEGFSSDNISWLSTEVSKFSRNSVLIDPSDLEDRIARGFIRSGSMIQRNQVEVPAEINQGDRVELTIENSHLKLSARMKALERGRTGDWIRVENEKTRRVVKTRVIAPGKVSIN